MSVSKPHLVLRFALASLVALALLGAGGVALMTGFARDRAEADAEAHALYVVESVLSPALGGVDLSRPVAGTIYDRVRELVVERVFSDGRTVRVKVWAPDGTIVFADEPALVGTRFPQEVDELEAVMAGEVRSGVSDLGDAENRFERPLAHRLLFTYAPLRQSPQGPVVGVAELYQDYELIQSNLDEVLRRMAVLLGAGLVVLYALLLPIATRAARELRVRNERLNELLENEQRTVAELRDLNRKMDDFVGAATHELRTPLTSIIGYLSTLRRPELGGDPAVRTEFLEAADMQTRRLLRLITNLLSAAGLEEDARPVTIEQVDLAALARAVVAELPEAGDRVIIDIPSQRPVPTDRARIAEVLTNLIENALKYSPAGSPVEVGSDVRADGYRVWVRDRGVGIAPEEQATVFERFRQVDQSSTRRFGGVGLGLYLSNGLVRELGGRIELSSEPGQGSTFTVVLPNGRVPDGGLRVAATTAVSAGPG